MAVQQYGKKLRTGDRVQDSMQEDTRAAHLRLNDFLLFDGVPITINSENEMTTAANGTRYNHRLGRVPRGFIVTGQTTISHGVSRVSQDERFITLRSITAIFRGDIWVF